MNPRLRLRAHGAFTLIEVLLAIGLTTALLLVAMTFYQQAANLRTQILLASEQLTAVRLTLDQVTADLRSAAQVPSASFIGGPSSLEFVRLTPPSTRPPGTNQTARIFVGSYQRLLLATFLEQKGTNLSVTGISRTESPLHTAPASGDSRSRNQGPAGGMNEPARPASPFTTAVHFLHFRYWNGAAWQDSWFAPAPPPGIEITLGAEPLPDDATPETYPYEQFRRVVVIPAGRTPDPSAGGTNAEPFELTAPPDPL